MAYPALILGTWTCKASLTEDGAKAETEFTNTYTRDGNVTGFGEGKVSFDGNKILFEIETEGTWSLDGAILDDKATGQEITSMDITGPLSTSGNSELVKIMLRESMDQEMENGELDSSMRIDLLNQTRLQLTDLEDGTETLCKRK